MSMPRPALGASRRGANVCLSRFPSYSSSCLVRRVCLLLLSLSDSDFGSFVLRSFVDDDDLMVESCCVVLILILIFLFIVFFNFSVLQLVFICS